MKDFFENVTDSLGDELIKGIAIALSIIMLFSGGFFFGTITSPKAAEDTAVNATEAPQTTQATTAPTTQPTTALIMDMTVNMLGTHEASCEIAFEKDYTITY